MTSPVGVFQTKLSNKLKDVLPAGIDLSILVPLLVQILVDMLGNCGSKERAIEIVKNPKSFLARYAARKAVRECLRECECSVTARERFAAQQVLLDTCSELSDAELGAAIDEALEAVDYTLI